MTSRLRRAVGHFGIYLWRRRKRSALWRTAYDLAEDFASGGDDRKKALLRWMYRETNKGWGRRVPHPDAVDDELPPDMEPPMQVPDDALNYLAGFGVRVDESFSKRIDDAIVENVVKLPAKKS